MFHVFVVRIISFTSIHSTVFLVLLACVPRVPVRYELQSLKAWLVALKRERRPDNRFGPRHERWRVEDAASPRKMASRFAIQGTAS